jgi:hypothetical protein
LAEQLLQNPAFQAAILPFSAALLVAILLQNTRLLGLTQLAAFLAMASLSIGFSLESLTAVKKLMLITLGSGLAVVALEWLPSKRSQADRLLLALLAAGSIWMLWRFLGQLDGVRGWGFGALSALYVAALVGSTLRVSEDPVRGASVGLMLGVGTGGLGILGASAVLGSAAIAVGAGAGAALLLQMLRGKPAAVGRTIAVPAATVAALAGVLATFSGALPWYCLVPVLAAPWASCLVPGTVQRVWLKAVVCSALALAPMAVAIALAWFAPRAAP